MSPSFPRYNHPLRSPNSHTTGIGPWIRPAKLPLFYSHNDWFRNGQANKVKPVRESLTIGWHYWERGTSLWNWVKKKPPMVFGHHVEWTCLRMKSLQKMEAVSGIAGGGKRPWFKTFPGCLCRVENPRARCRYYQEEDFGVKNMELVACAMFPTWKFAQHRQRQSSRHGSIMCLSREDQTESVTTPMPAFSLTMVNWKGDNRIL